ncbi:hypothetical protein D8674_000403 [Pyrus ussuriensis x Pyrus communis]|uniref:Uncharacterized protein n=1 Tax=Pyrus ussuriensis x Pyrus communis TaxID=2448454 RepID=A0A5N5F402_9ROSA|nr:hypothetical protein D8674_000403 [Pyrus ussuriensis x Pyrus communis]
MATINGFRYPNMYKSQLLHTTFAYQRSSFTKIPCDRHQLIRRNHHQRLIVGLMLTIIIPSLRHKWGPLLALKGKVDMVIETVKSVTEVVEELVEEVEKVAEQVTDKLPEDAELREAMESIEHLADEAVKKAELAKDVIHKVEEMEKDVEKALTTGSDTIDPGKGEEGQKSP